MNDWSKHIHGKQSKQMTFAEKKIEEFRITFDCSNDEDVTNWLRQTIAEAEREGQREAYRDAISCWDDPSWRNTTPYEYCNKKLKELEGE